jgi:hypothetical protein
MSEVTQSGYSSLMHVSAQSASFTCSALWHAQTQRKTITVNNRTFLKHNASYLGRVSYSDRANPGCCFLAELGRRLTEFVLAEGKHAFIHLL